jgi:hypothetical protein
MQSALIDRSFAKPRGYAGDYWTMELFYRDEAAGAGRLGPLIDRWYLGMHSVRAARNRRAVLAGVIREEAARGTARPVPVTSLASGPARELFDVFAGSNPLLSWIHDHLLPGGLAVVGNFDTASPDRSFGNHILEWDLIYRSEDDLRGLFAASAFAGPPDRIVREAAGVQLFAFTRRP